MPLGSLPASLPAAVPETLRADDLPAVSGPVSAPDLTATPAPVSVGDLRPAPETSGGLGAPAVPEPPRADGSPDVPESAGALGPSSPGPHAPWREVERDGEADAVAVEEPLEIRVDGRPLSVTMRTPGHDEELALGFLLGEGLIDGPRAVGLTADFAANTIEVGGPLLRDPGERRFYTTSSCGVCGKGALEEVAVASAPLGRGPVVDRDLLAALPDRLEQPTFERTGGVHATGLFDAAGQLTIAREDVGRHNAMDKVIGRALLDGLVPLTDRILCVSGRLSFELVQKAAVAGAPILVGVGAPSSLAIELAADRGLTLCGFTRRGHTNVYTCPDRVRSS